MNEAERNGLALMRDCWIGGGLAAALAPAAWRALVAEAPASAHELLLLAIAAQALDVGFRPAAPGPLAIRPALPKLGLPSLPDRHRALFRSALKNAAAERGKLRVVGLAAARGYVAHPLDWMPTISDPNTPEAYAPWLDWQAQASGNGPVLDALTADNWGDFLPAARRVALADLRRGDPAAARAMLEAKAGAEAAEHRLSLIELLRVNLSEADAPYLQSLAADRSGKVKQLAISLLARIGHGQSGDDAEAKELADFIEQGRVGLLRRRNVYAPKPLKNYAQISRRNTLFHQLPLIDLATALGTDEIGLIEGWQLGGSGDVDASLAHMVGSSGSDAAAQKFGERLIGANDANALAVLLPRLDAGAGRAFIAMLLSQQTSSQHQLASMSDGVEAGSFDQAALMGSALYQNIRTTIRNRQDGERAVPDLALFGFLATAAAAQAIIADLTPAGLGPADPSLALLRLNAALIDRSASE